MNLKIEPLQKKDYGKAIAFAVAGMHFNRYTDSDLLLKLYGRYFWYMELSRASQAIAAYYGGRIVGVLLADMNGEPKCHSSAPEKAYVKLIDFVQGVFYRDSAGEYDKANAQMYRLFSEKYKADGEICFLAADPNAEIRGVGTLLLQELERREAGKRIYLYTDNNCTYQFYEHRGFERASEKQINLSFTDKGGVPLSCYLYTKVCGKDGETHDR